MRKPLSRVCIRSGLSGLTLLGVLWSDVSALAQDSKPKIVVQASAQEKRDLKVLRLRPAPVEQTFQVFVTNPTKDDKKFIVKMRVGDMGPELAGPVECDVKAGQNAAVSFGKKVVAAGAAGATEVKPTFHTFVGPTSQLGFVLLEKRGDKEVEIEKRQVPISVLAPTQYVEFADAKYDEVKNELTVRVKAGPQFSGPECPVRLVLPAERIPGYIANSGTGVPLQRLKSPGEEQTLVRRGLKFKGTPRGFGYGYISVDGYDRAYVFEITLGQGGVSTPRLLGVDDTSVRLDAKPFIRPGDKYPVRVEVDNPPSTNLIVEVGLDRDGDGAFSSPGEIVNLAGPREHRVQFRTDAEKLVFKVDVSDCQTEFNIAEMTGPHGIRVRLLSGDNIVRFLDKHNKYRESLDERVTVTSAAPKNVRLDANVEGGKIVVVAKAEEKTELIGAKFFLGKPVPGKDGKEAPADAVDGIQSPDNKLIWTGKLDLPTEPMANMEIGVELTNAIQMKAFGASKLPLARNGPGDAAKPGKIKIKVTEGDLVQLTLEVVLSDAKGTEKDKKAKADADGYYIFEDLPPGSYKVSSFKSATGRRGSLSLKVEADKTTERELELKLP